MGPEKAYRPKSESPANGADGSSLPQREKHSSTPTHIAALMKSEPFVAEPCLSLRDRRGRPASETGFLPCIESRYRWTLRLRRRIISITSKNPAVSQSTVCMIMSFMTGGSPFLSLELLHHREEIFEYL
jgi:hypothetical protein